MRFGKHLPLLSVAVVAMAFQASPPDLGAEVNRIGSDTLAQAAVAQPQVNDGNLLGPPLGPAGQRVPAAERLRWAREQIRTLAGTPGADRLVFRSLERQLDAALGPEGQAAVDSIGGPGREGSGMGSTAATQPAPVAPEPLLQAGEHVRLMKGYLDVVGDIERAAGSPLGATTMAVFAIVETGKQDADTAIATLQSLLEQEQAPPGRTVIRLGLKDLYEKAGNREAAMEQLAAIVRENAEALKGQETRRPPPPPPPPR